jgi:regulator of PEP synthase PpsR (kinase-PPPase family)
LDEIKESLTESPEYFEEDTYYALRLYFQRQTDLRAKRRLLKGYSSIDMERYGLRSDSKPIIFKPNEDDTERGEALEYTMQTDDGMSPRLLHKADVVLLGVSRVGKTPMSLVLSQTKGMRVANIPLVLEVDPPRQLFQVDARKVFLITQDAKHLEQVRRERLRREIKKRVGSRSTYADPDYVRRDLEKARGLARDQGFTIIDITNRAMEEAASLIMSKIKERFPEKDFGDAYM